MINFKVTTSEAYGLHIEDFYIIGVISRLII